MHADDFSAALLAGGPMHPIPPGKDLYGWLEGTWEFTWFHKRGTPEERSYPGEWLFSWIIMGQAMQDVFICPTREARQNECPQEAEYGTTVRIYKPDAGEWEVIYMTGGGSERFTAKRDGPDRIVQECISCQGYRMRWVFAGITAVSFHWSNSISRDDGETWELRGELMARRRGWQAPLQGD